MNMVFVLTKILFMYRIKTVPESKTSEVVCMNTVGCIRAKMGSTEYYIAKMRAGQLIDSVGFAKEMVEWEQMSADEKMQRTLDVNRVITEIVPYVTSDPDRFFGAVIVDIYSGYDELIFESVSKVLPVP